MRQDSRFVSSKISKALDKVLKLLLVNLARPVFIELVVTCLEILFIPGIHFHGVSHNLLNKLFQVFFGDARPTIVIKDRQPWVVLLKDFLLKLSHFLFNFTFGRHY